MEWFHKCSQEWMEARSKYLTASDISKLLPVTPTGRKRNVKQAQFQIWAKKQSRVFDTVSTGAAARGHIMEKYAVEAYNAVAKKKINHWDDALIYREEGLAFSPDALDVPQSEAFISGVEYESFALFDVSIGGEIKSYSTDKHIMIGMSDPTDLEERWQIATAFCVLPNLEYMNLILFNPGCKYQMFVHTYSRSMLSAEMRIIWEIVKEYNKAVKAFENSVMISSMSIPASMTEESIAAASSMNP